MKKLETTLSLDYAKKLIEDVTGKEVCVESPEAVVLGTDEIEVEMLGVKDLSEIGLKDGDEIHAYFVGTIDETSLASVLYDVNYLYTVVIQDIDSGDIVSVYTL